MNTANPPRRCANRAGVRHAYIDRARIARRQRTGRVADDVVLFAALLRSCGASVPGEASARAVRALSEVALRRREDVRVALRATLVSDQPSTRLFDLLFPLFWSTEDAVETTTEAAPGSGSPICGGQGGAETVDTASEAGQLNGSHTPRPTAGNHRDDSTDFVPTDVPGIDHEVRRIVRILASAPGRRRRVSSTGDPIDLGESLRCGARSGELIQLRYTRPRPRRAEVAVLCDVSSSMRGVANVFLRVTQAFARYARLVEAGIFHVDLTLVGAELRRYRPNTAIRRITARAGALCGGTRIGYCLAEFLDAVESELGPHIVMFVFSDGWEVDEPDLLATQMRRLRQRVGRVVWCDPHAAATGFKPQVRGLCAALPFVDDYLDLSSPAALPGIADHFAHNRIPRRIR